MSEVVLKFDGDRLVSVKSPSIEFVPLPPTTTASEPAKTAPRSRTTSKATPKERRRYGPRQKNRWRLCERVGCNRPFEQHSCAAHLQTFCAQCQAVRKREKTTRRAVKHRNRGLLYG